MKLEKYQIEGADFLAQRKHALLADDMGLGKTAQAITAADKLGLRNILVICPASVKAHWGNEFKKWYTRPAQVSIVQNGRSNIDLDANITIVNYELLLSKKVNTHLHLKDWDILICDEAHYLKALTSQRSKKVLGKFGLVQRANYKWMLTGTPIENRPVDLFPMLYVLNRKGLGKYANYESYLMQYCDGYYCRMTGQPKPNGSSNEEGLKQSLNGFMLRRTLEDRLPRAQVQIIRMPKSIKIESLEKDTLGEESQGALASLRQEIALAKMPDAIKYIKDTLGTIDKVVVFAYHRAVIDGLAKGLERFNPVKFYGGLNMHQKEEIKNKFIKEPNCKVLIGQIKAAGTGLDGLQEVCHHMIFVEIDWAPFRQCIGRLKRLGQKKDQVVVQVLLCEDSLDEAMLGTVTGKVKSIDKILGD
ncbi:MAG: DEAD/DEAH box helicase [Colwellia sp.]|nr:DEAD/DEAH box helicase [Colwellia sp.]